MNREEFDIISCIIQKRRGPKTRKTVVESAFHFINTGEGDRHSKRYAERVTKTKEMLLETGGDIINLANMHANINGAVSDGVFDAAVHSLENDVSPTRSALEHGCYSASVYSFVKCIKSAKADYEALVRA